MANIPLYLREKDVNHYLLRDITQKVDRINSHLEYNTHIKERYIKDLIADANVHSFTMELEGTTLGSGQNGEEILRKQLAKQGYIDLTGAWNFATASYQGNFSHDLILNIASRVEPTLTETRTILGKGSEYRKTNLRVTGANSIPPIKGERVEKEMDSLLDFLNDDTENPLVKATFSHLHFARIHPLYDGNGRTARLLQNLILYADNIPGVRIEDGERVFYRSLLRNALKEYNERESENEWHNGSHLKTFFEYIASIENVNLDRLEKELEANRSYQINVMGTKEVPLFMKAKHMFQDAIRAQMPDKGIKVNLSNDKKHILIKGNITTQEIQGIIKSICKNGVPCEVVPIIR